MIINPSLPTGHAVFCDDIREEVGGKLTYVGVYGNVMIISAAAPATLSQLCVAVSVRIEPPIEPLTTTVRILRSDGDEIIAEAQAVIEPPANPSSAPSFADANSVSFRELFVPIRVAGVLITQDCAIKVRAYIGDDEIRLGSLRVIFAEPPNEKTVS